MMMTNQVAFGAAVLDSGVFLKAEIQKVWEKRPDRVLDV